MMHVLSAFLIAFAGWVITCVVTLSLFPAYGCWPVALSPFLISGGMIAIWLIQFACAAAATVLRKCYGRETPPVKYLQNLHD